MGIFDSIFDPGRAYRKAADEYKKGWEQAQGYEKPYWQSGTDQINKLTGAEDKLLDPSKLQSEWAAGYETSPYAKQLQDQAMSQGLDSAGSMGLLGSSSALQSLQQGSTNIMQKDRQNYMDDLMKKYLSGIGIGQNMFNTGATMGGKLGDQSMSFGEQMGKAKFGDMTSKNKMISDLINLAIRGGMAYGTGGASEAGNAMSSMNFNGKNINFSTPEP